MDARRFASTVHVEFTKAAEASNRAVMADTDGASAEAAEEAQRARLVATESLEALRALLQELGYADDLKTLDTFARRFDTYRQLDDEILPLSVENTNLKAQRLSFGEAQKAADALRRSLDDAVAAAGPTRDCCARGLAARARSGVLEVQVLQAPHIAEADDGAMTRMETQMTVSAAAARQALQDLRAVVPTTGRSAVSDAQTALDRFLTVNTEIVALSRRNSNVRSLALSFGRKRTVTAECDDALRQLEEALAKHQLSGTR